MTAFVAREIIRYEGPFPYVDGLILQVTQNIDRLLVDHLPRVTGNSNYTVRRLLRLWMNMFVNFSIMPLRISTVTGFALSALGGIGMAIAVGEALLSSPPPGWASLMAAVLLLSGVQLLILVIIGEYLGLLYLTANQSPQSVAGKCSVSNPKIQQLAIPSWLRAHKCVGGCFVSLTFLSRPSKSRPWNAVKRCSS
jgi:undecaprenyl-phosphate 4-deoxy-4-formamido-L-arabinose transferase